MTGTYPKYLQILDRPPSEQTVNFQDVLTAVGSKLLPRGGRDVTVWMNFLNI